VAAGLDFSMALDELGRVFTWGAGRSGVLGYGNGDDQLEPKAVAALEGQKVSLIACGGSHALAATKEGKLYWWGASPLGKDSKEPAHNLPAVVTWSGGDIVHLAAGKSFSVAVSAAGCAYSWGAGSKGALGHGDEQSVPEPKKIAALDGVQVLHSACGWSHSAFVSADGAVYTCGSREFGKLGY